MCGIAGCFSYSDVAPAVEQDELLTMSDSMICRGPDAEGLWMSEDRQIGLAHRRLSIIDLSDNANQPMTCGDSRIQLVYNGEIYNYRSLRENLESKGYKFKSTSDTEVLLNLYLEKGSSMVQDLRGMYAFAIWDEREETLLLGRDPFGIKPLYYADNGKVLRFASQVKALLRVPGVDKELGPAGAVGFFVLGFVPDPYTVYRGIRALPAGSLLVLQKGQKAELKTFFEPASLWQEGTGSSDFTRKEALLQLKECLLDSVEHHLIADVPTGLFLSAGLDSATLTTLAAEVKSTPVHTVTLGFKQYEGSIENEVPLAEEIARKLGTTHQTKWVTKDDFLVSLKDFFEAMDQPTIDGLNMFLVSKVAAESGLTVALSGLGGDELFGGYPSFAQIPAVVKLNRLLPSQLVGKTFRRISAPILKYYTSPKYAGLFEYGRSFNEAYLLRRGLFMPWELPKVLDAEVASAGWQELKPQLLCDHCLNGISSSHRKVSALEMILYMRSQLLRVSDWAGMAHSLEIRVPFVDLPVLQHVAELSEGAKPFSKLDMTRHLLPSLPAAVLERRKTPFAVPIRQWLGETFPELRLRRLGWRAWGKKVWEEYQRH